MNQAEQWEAVLRGYGVPEEDVRRLRLHAETVLGVLSMIDDDIIEREYGFGDHDRGVATLTTLCAYDGSLL